MAEEWRVVAREAGDALDERRAVVGLPGPGNRPALPAALDFPLAQGDESLLDLVGQTTDDLMELLRLPQLGLEFFLDELLDDALVAVVGAERFAQLIRVCRHDCSEPSDAGLDHGLR